MNRNIEQFLNLDEQTVNVFISWNTFYALLWYGIIILFRKKVWYYAHACNFSTVNNCPDVLCLNNQ